MDRTPTSQMSVTAIQENKALELKIDAFNSRLENFDESCKGVFTAFIDLLKELPGVKSLTGVLSESALDKVDSIILFNSAIKGRNTLQRLKDGPWELRPYHFIIYWGIEKLQQPTFLRNLARLSTIEPKFQDAMDLLDKNGPKSRSERQEWQPKHVHNAIRASPKSNIVVQSRCEALTRSRNAGEPTRNKSRTVSLVGSFDQPSATARKSDKSSPLSYDRNEVDHHQVITIPDEESIDTNEQSTAGYIETMRAKCINSLQPDTWLIEDAFDAILSPFIAHREDVLILNPSLVDVDHPTANRNKKIRDLKPSHKTLLIPLNINKQHWIVAILNPSAGKGLIYDPLHLKTNIDQAKLALNNFGQPGLFSALSYSKHTVRISFSDIPSSLTFVLTILHNVPPRVPRLPCGETLFFTCLLTPRVHVGIDISTISCCSPAFCPPEHPYAMISCAQ
jgi:hypothetical protein